MRRLLHAGVLGSTLYLAELRCGGENIYFLQGEGGYPWELLRTTRKWWLASIDYMLYVYSLHTSDEHPVPAYIRGGIGNNRMGSV